MGNVIISGVALQMAAPLGLPDKGTPLNDCSWAEISKAAELGVASEYFSVGDWKEIKVKGKVGYLTLDATYRAYILGFNHNGATNTIDFGTFKNTSNVSITFVDDHDVAYTNGSKVFNINHWGSSTYGGWKGCDMRYDILGSTDVAPSGYGSNVTSSRTGYDATENCATNPVPDTFMAALPFDLRAVMKPMTIYTDNVGYRSSTAGNVTKSIDYLPLLAEFEVQGAITNANSAEQNYQKQYAYYAAGNSKYKYIHTAGSDTAQTNLKYQWTRSQNSGNGSQFCVTGPYGAPFPCDAHKTYGINPIFRV